ncbi:hypothetical protein [Clostridium uliginosum]|uniref:Uncharacterized protein n=1 Tax=Clostridium uliginosum TaxID=119641 RepID=A0A1I1Q3Y1_9CLOT|nr:hypothetical protein [Clostridium uliginosum]SFD14578.1 hypothetical protein SAMN05421842_12160 [Clostridium uliginosum]
MDYIQFTLKVLSVLFIYIVIMKICMVVANYVGEQLGLGKSLIYLWRKIRKK